MTKLETEEDDNYNRQRVINTSNENKETLERCSVENLGPIGSIDKLLKLKKNGPNRRCERDREESR
jgi:hypothetical protein